MEECPFNLLVDGGDGIPTPVEAAGEMCVNCGHCVAICPGDAIAVNGMTAEDCDEVDPAKAVSAEQVEQLFRSRRSVRVYKDEPVERETLERLLDMARWAPTARNKQPVHWLVLTDRDEIAELSRMVASWLREVGRYLPIADAVDKGKDMVNRDAPCLLIAHAGPDALKPVEDCSIALTTIEAAAPAFGLGACWGGLFMAAAQNCEPLRDRLNLPEGHTVYGALMLGRPKFRFRRIPPREAVKVTWR